MNEKTEEELKLLQSYLAPNSSESMEYFSIDFDKLTNEQIKFVISDWLPNQIIKIGPYSIYYLRKDIVSQDFWNDLVDLLYKPVSKEACRGKINKNYIYEGLFGANLIVLCFLRSTITETKIIDSKKIKRELLHGVFVAEYGKEYDFLDKDEAFIVNTCFVEIKQLKIKLGLFMRCLGLSILKNLGIRHIYTEALNKELVKYYGSLGFKMFIPDNIDTLTQYPKGKKLKCNDTYAVEQIDKIYKKLNLQNIIELVQGKEPKWYMSICNFDETDICFKSFDSLRKELRKVDFDSVVFEKLIEKLNESNNKEQSLEERWTEGEKRLLELKEPKILYKYIKGYIGERWPEGEKNILETKDPKLIYEYARDIIKGRWPEGEKIILEEAEKIILESEDETTDIIIEYARDVIKGRWIEGEKIILESEKSEYILLLYKYAKDVIKGRWPIPERKQAEAKIIKIPPISYEYARDILKGRWPMPERKQAEAKIIEIPRISFIYARDVLKGRWPNPERKEVEDILFKSEYALDYLYLIPIDNWNQVDKNIFTENIKRIINDLNKNKILSSISKKELISLKNFIINILIPNIPFNYDFNSFYWKDHIKLFYKLVLEIVNLGGFEEILPLLNKYKMFELAVLYAQNLNKRIPEIENFLFLMNGDELKDYYERQNHKNMLFNYINLFWEDKEDPELWELLKRVRPLEILIDFNKMFLKKPLKILESLILNEEDEKLLWNIQKYASDIIQGRWEEVEPLMLKTYKKHMEDTDYYEVDDYGIYKYSSEILKRRWNELEPLMYKKYKMQDSTEGLENYLEHFKISIDELVKDENQIKKSTKSKSRSRSRSPSPKRSGSK
jgi:hypothetical protein